jgi:hypothetical protein
MKRLRMRTKIVLAGFAINVRVVESKEFVWG